jgi:hypothetical protein
LLGSEVESPYATKHKIAPAHSNKAKGEVNYFNNFKGQGVPFFYVNLLGPSSNNLLSASSGVKPLLESVLILSQNC